MKGLLEEGSADPEHSRPETDSGKADGKNSKPKKRKHKEEFVLPFQNEDLGAILEKMKELEVYLFWFHLIKSEDWRG
jgi:hypothetical protein